jgi:AcrR family transcriptional regulator
MSSSLGRVDARENRARIVEAARNAIAAAPDAADLRLNAIAKQAGIGQGTLYRHFPTRADLLAEVYRSEVEELVALAKTLLETEAPDRALALWFDGVVDYARVKRGVLAAVEAAVWQDLAAHSLGPIGEAITTLLEAGRAAGLLRPDVDAADVITLIGFLTRLDALDWDARARHLMTVVLDGLRAVTP